MALLVPCAAIAQNKVPVKVTDMLKIRSVSSVTLSPDDKKVVFVVTSIEPDGDSKLDYKYVSQLWLASTDGAFAPRQITSAKDGSSQPAWNADSKQIVFARAADGKAQLFLLNLDGGEATQLTNFRYGASAPKFSPDGKRLLFAASISLNDLLKDSLLNPGKKLPAWPFEKPGFDDNSSLAVNNAKANPDGSLEEVRAYLDKDVADKKARVMDKLNFQDEMNVSADMSFSHLFITDARPGAEPVALTHGFYRFNSASFMPDGKQVVFSGDMDSLQHPDRSLQSEVFIADTNGTHIKLLLGAEGKVFGSPTVSPSGKWISYIQATTSFVTVPSLYIMPSNGDTTKAIVVTLDRAKTGFTWSKDEAYLYFTAQSNGGVPLYRFNMKTKQVEQLTDYNAGINAFDVVNNKVVYSKTSVADPFELFMADASAKNEQQLTKLNDWVEQRQLSFPEKKTFTNSQGMTVEYWVMKPTGYTPGKKYPLLLDIHGGPSAMWGPGENSMWHEFQFFCSKGYGVVYCNPRGSGGYGYDFLRANVNDWGTGPTSDVLTALDKTVAEGWGDTSRMVVTGGSYAGYLVAWIIGHDHRFKAACSQRGVYDLGTFFGEGNAWRLVPNYFGGYPWQPETKAILERESPITYVQNITTPYIIFHGDNDRRTGFVEGEMLYRSLKVLGRPVEYVRHPGATHEITRAGDNRQRIDQMLRTWEFFERWINKK